MPKESTVMINFSKMVCEELNSLYDFAAPIWFECYNGVLENAQIDYLTHRYFDSDNVLSFCENGMIYENILYNGQRAGFIAYSVSRDHLYLDKIYIKKDFRGLHISSAAFDYLQKTYHLPIRLNVNQGNDLGIRAYLGNGFKIVEEKEYPLPHGFVNVDYIMEKPL